MSFGPQSSVRVYGVFGQSLRAAASFRSLCASARTGKMTDHTATPRAYWRRAAVYTFGRGPRGSARSPRPSHLNMKE